MILLTQPETLIFQLLHHAVENQHNAVGFLLSDRSQADINVLEHALKLVADKR